MNVMNRKLFANRDARRKLANMGGIIASSPELLGTAQTFENGGQTFSSIFSRLMAPATYNMSRLGSLDEPTQTGLDDIETTSKIAQDQMAVLSKAKAGETLGKIAKDLALDVTDVINIIAGGASLLATELTGLAGDVAGIVTSAVNQDAGKFILEKAQDVKDFGRGAYFDEGKTLPRLVDTDMRSFSRAATIEEAAKKQEELKQSQGLTTPEQRAAIQEQSLAAIERASPETLRDTGESVGITGRASLPNVKTDVTTSVGGLGSIPTSDQVGVSPTGGFTGVRTMSGYGDSGIMSQAPGISVPNVDIGEAGLENARQEANLRRFIATENPEFYNPLAKEMGQRAREYYDTDTFTLPSEIYSDLLGGDPRAIAKYQGESPEEVQAVSDRLAREAAADEAAKEQRFFTEQDEAIQSEYDEANAKQQAMLDADADAASLEDLKTTAEEIKEKKEKTDPETLPVLGDKDADVDAKAAQEESFSRSDAPKKIQENLKKNPDNPAGAVTTSTLNDEGIDTSNMSLKERVKSMRGVLSELIGDSDEDKNEEFWLAMARIGFGVAAGEDPNALKNIADGVLDGVNEIAKDRKADKKRDDDLTLAAFDMVRQDERDALNYQRQIGLIDARQRATQDEDISNAFRLQKNAYVKSLTDMVPKYGTGSDTSIEEINRQATNLAFQDLATQFSPTVLKQSTLYQSPSNKTFIDNAIEALNAQQYL